MADDIIYDDMMQDRERYINPYTDFGFKKLFGTEMNKDLLISFINALLGESREVIDLEYLNSEHLGDGYGDRRAIFDVYCKTEDGSRFIVEMQKGEQNHFKDRSVYYSTYAIREQATKGKRWDYRLNDVYTVGILNFKFPDNEYPADSYLHEIKLTDVEDHHVFYDKLTFLYLEIPKFNKGESELVTMLDKWMFVLRNLSRLLDRPAALQERVFTKLFDQAEIAQYTPDERREYETSVKNYWDYYSTLDTALAKGRAEGLEEGMAKGLEQGMAKGLEQGMAKGLEQGMAKGLEQGMAKGLEQGMAKGLEQGQRIKSLEAARKMKSDGIAISLIVKYTGLTAEDVAAL